MRAGILTQAKKAKNEIDISQTKEENILTNYEDYIKQSIGEASKPILKEGMKKVYWEETTNEEITQENRKFDESKWYDYSQNRWANAITTDGSYWVWIPRYEYRIINNITNPSESGSIDIKFISINMTLPSEGYTIHPAFTSDIENGGWDKEISGFWCAKFEMSMENERGEHIDTDLTNVGNVSISNNVKMVSKPNVSSWRNISIANMYTNSFLYNREAESHLMKNSEWGAVAYLTHSKYGKNGIEVAKNISNEFKTGNSGGSGNSLEGSTIYEFNTEKGKLASSTGNLTGVYDLNGGCYEYVASFNSSYSGELYTGELNLDTSGNHFANFNGKSTKYVTAYSNDTTIKTIDFSIGKVSITGDAIEETYVNEEDGWFNDTVHFVTIEKPFYARGGKYSDMAGSGIFCSTNGSGSPYNIATFRVVLV